MNILVLSINDIKININYLNTETIKSHQNKCIICLNLSSIEDKEDFVKERSVKISSELKITCVNYKACHPWGLSFVDQGSL